MNPSKLKSIAKDIFFANIESHHYDEKNKMLLWQLRMGLLLFTIIILASIYGFFMFDSTRTIIISDVIIFGLVTIFILMVAKVFSEHVILSKIQRLQNIDKLKSEFVALASHQLRTPLSIINLYSNLLLSEDTRKLTSDQKKYTQEIDKGVKRMAELIDAILNVSKIELGTFSGEPKPSKLTETLDAVLSEFTPQAESKEISLSKHYDDGLPLVDIDPKLVSVVFQNLLSNSIKYTSYKGEIAVSVKKQPRDSGVVAVIADTGCGIPKNQQANVFTKMFRADNAKRKVTDGTGLGLYIVKAIVDNSKGKIWFESEENKGTKFFISLPAARTGG